MLGFNNFLREEKAAGVVELILIICCFDWDCINF